MNTPVPLYGEVPPEAETVTVVVPPWQAMAAPWEEETLRAEGSVMVILVTAVQPLSSVTV